jgi:hypothetical protein
MAWKSQVVSLAIVESRTSNLEGTQSSKPHAYTDDIVDAQAERGGGSAPG